MSRAALFWVEIVCRDCATTRSCQFVRSRIPVRALTNEATRAGWILLSNGDWLCPDCKRDVVECATTQDTRPGHPPMTADDVRARFERQYSEDDVRACAKRMKFYDHQVAASILTEYAGLLAAHADRDAEVRELVEADLEYDAARSRYEAAFRPGPYGDLHAQMDAQHQMRKAKSRRSAALAKLTQEKP